MSKSTLLGRMKLKAKWNAEHAVWAENEPLALIDTADVCHYR